MTTNRPAPRAPRPVPTLAEELKNKATHTLCWGLLFSALWVGLHVGAARDAQQAAQQQPPVGTVLLVTP